MRVVCVNFSKHSALAALEHFLSFGTMYVIVRGLVQEKIVKL